jgi:hypothetical protein
MNIFKYFLLFLIWTAPLAAGDLSGISGAFADIGFGARPVGMGGAYTAVANDVNSILWNPAGLSHLSMNQVTFTQTKQLGLVNYQYLAGAMPLSGKNNNAIGLALITCGDKVLREFTLQTSYSQTAGPLQIGASLKMRYASFGNNTLNSGEFPVFDDDEIQEGILNQVSGSAYGFGFDIGLQYPLAKQVTLGLMLKDIYSPVFWDSKVNNPDKKAKGKYSELIPFQPVIGAAFRLSDDVTVAGDYIQATQAEVSNKLRFGIEGTLFDILSLRGGMQNYINNENDEKYIAGVGLNLGVIKDLKVMIDYSYMIEKIANTQRFSLSVEF